MCTIPRAVATPIVILALKSWLSEHLPDWPELYVDLKNVLKDISMLNISRWYHNAKLRSERKECRGKKKQGFWAGSGFLSNDVEKVNSGALRNSEVLTFQDSHPPEQISTAVWLKSSYWYLWPAAHLFLFYSKCSNLISGISRRIRTM